MPELRRESGVQLADLRRRVARLGDHESDAVKDFAPMASWHKSGREELRLPGLNFLPAPVRTERDDVDPI